MIGPVGAEGSRREGRCVGIAVVAMVLGGREFLLEVGVPYVLEGTYRVTAGGYH